MRIVHEVLGQATVTCGAELYAKAVDEQYSPGFRVTALVVVEERGVVPHEEIHIEGSARHVLAALRELVTQIEVCGDLYVRDGHLRADWQETEQPKNEG